MDSGDMVTLPPETTLSTVYMETVPSAKLANHLLKSVTMLLSVFSNVMVVISTITKIMAVITSQRHTQQNVLVGQAAIKQNPFVASN